VCRTLGAPKGKGFRFAYWRLRQRDPGRAYYFAGWIVIFIAEAAVSAAFGVWWLVLLGVVGALAAWAALVSAALYDDTSLVALARLPGRLRRREGRSL
jgi:hypothetical protein